MNPKHRRKSYYGKTEVEKKPSAVRKFVEQNTHSNITMKREFMYIEDLKTAININTLEERIMLKRWFLKQLQDNISKEKIIEILFDSSDKDRHTLQKYFQITL